MANTVLIDVMRPNEYDAGTKARNDVRDILSGMGFANAVVFNRIHNSAQKLLEVYQAIFRLGSTINPGDLIVLQYPYNPAIVDMLLKRIRKVREKKACKLIILVHDLFYLRKDDQYKDIEKKEVGFLNCADGVIVHNDRMAAELHRVGVKTRMVSLQLFDYLFRGDSASIHHSKENVIAFAGNLMPGKSGFIYQSSKLTKVLFNLYGTNPGELPENMHYHGSFEPNELPAHLEGTYGLVWDGPSAENCIGNYGEYLKYNCPHKASLYIACGLPVVVWKEAAIAQFITDHQMGVAISSLAELDDLPKPESEEYKKLLDGVHSYQQRIRNGEMLKQAISNFKNDRGCWFEKYRLFYC